MRNFILLSVSLFSFAVSAAVVEPFAFFSFTNGTAGASAYGVTVNNDVGTGFAMSVSISRSYRTSYPPRYSAERPAKILFANSSSTSGDYRDDIQALCMSNSAAIDGGSMSISGAASELSKCHGANGGYTCEYFFRMQASDKYNASKFFYSCDAGYAGGVPFYLYLKNPTTLGCGIGTTISDAAIPAINDGFWHHVAIVETSDGYIEVWIDYCRYFNKLLASGAGVTTSKNLIIGNNAIQGFFTGIRLTKKALSSLDFQYAASRNRFVMSADTVAFYPFDDLPSNSDAALTSVCNAQAPTYCPGKIVSDVSTTAGVTYDADAPAKYVFSGNSYGASKIYENPASVCMTNKVSGASGSIDFRGLSTELSKCHSTGSTVEYFVKVSDPAMTVRKPVLISDAGYLLGSETNRFMLGVPYYGYGYQSTELAYYSVTNNLDRFDTRDDHSWSENLNFDIGVWHHIAIVEKSKTIKLYIDYIQRGEIHFDDYFTYDSQGGENPNAVKDLILGNYIQHCKISCVRVMKRALEPDEFMWATDNDGSVRGCGKPMFMKLMAH